jgi:hypothetical protein
MYKIRDKVYADAGYILVGNNRRGYVFKGELEEFTEQKITIEDMRVEGSFLRYSNDSILEMYSPNATYEELKAKIVKRLFSNDDQIAIMLNKGRSEQDDLVFEKMQEYRDWAGTLAKKIVAINNQGNE